MGSTLSPPFLSRSRTTLASKEELPVLLLVLGCRVVSPCLYSELELRRATGPTACSLNFCGHSPYESLSLCRKSVESGPGSSPRRNPSGTHIHLFLLALWDSVHVPSYINQLELRFCCVPAKKTYLLIKHDSASEGY